MKKLLFTLTLLFSLLSSAQEEIKYGINAGPTLSAIRGDGHAKDFSYAFGYMAGITIEKPLNQRFSFCAAINYERKSSVQKTNYSYSDTIIGPDGNPVDYTTEVDSKITTTLDYIVVPLNIKYYLDIYESYYVTGGGFAAYAFTDKYTVKGDAPTNGYQQDYKKMDYGVSLGFGTKFKLTRTQYLNIEIRDNFGVANITDIESDKISTNSISLIANWQFCP